MQQKIWNKSTKDTLGLQNFFNNNAKFKGKQLANVKGEVMNDYQVFLEQQWIDELRKNAYIKVNEKALRRFKKQYKQ